MQEKTRRLMPVFVTLLMVPFLLVGCQHPVPVASPQTGMLKSTALQQVTVHPLPDHEEGAQFMWSPSGNVFSYLVHASKGIYEVGTVNPLHFQQVQLGKGRDIIALTTHYAVVASNDDTEDWLYPLTAEGQVGQPVKWTAPVDTWQEWVETASGLAIVTGGYESGTLRLTSGNGENTLLSGGQVYTSSDMHYGAVTTRVRMKRVFGGHVMMPSAHQPDNLTDPVVIWDFSAPSGPRRLTTLHLPKTSLPQAAGDGTIQWISFSPDDHYVAVLTTGSYGTGGKIDGQTDIFDVRTGKLVGTARYGNGLRWLPNSNAIWLDTQYPAGQGDNEIVTVQGKPLSTWPESAGAFLLPIDSQRAILDQRGTLGIASNKEDFHVFGGYENVGYGDAAMPSNNGHAALSAFGSRVLLMLY